jgi:hypothetical protein
MNESKVKYPFIFKVVSSLVAGLVTEHSVFELLDSTGYIHVRVCAFVERVRWCYPNLISLLIFIKAEMNNMLPF